MTPTTPIPARRMLGLLRALGYPQDWLQKHLDTPINPANLSPHAADLIAAFYRFAGERMATPRPGLTAETIEATAAAARAEGYFPPAAYEGDELVLSAVIGTPRARTEELCDQRLYILSLLTEGRSISEAAAEVGVHRRTVYRVADAAAIQARTLGERWEAERDEALMQWREGREASSEIAWRIGLTRDSRAAHMQLALC